MSPPFRRLKPPRPRPPNRSWSMRPARLASPPFNSIPRPPPKTKPPRPKRYVLCLPSFRPHLVAVLTPTASECHRACTGIRNHRAWPSSQIGYVYAQFYISPETTGEKYNT